jgi:hypothetical protein
MRLATLLAIVASLALYSAANPPPAHCAYCTTFPCFSSDQCGADCECLSTGPGGGTCVSIE